MTVSKTTESVNWDFCQMSITRGATCLYSAILLLLIEIEMNHISNGVNIHISKNDHSREWSRKYFVNCKLQTVR